MRLTGVATRAIIIGRCMEQKQQDQSRRMMELTINAAMEISRQCEPYTRIKMDIMRLKPSRLFIRNGRMVQLGPDYTESEKEAIRLADKAIQEISERITKNLEESTRHLQCTPTGMELMSSYRDQIHQQVIRDAFKHQIKTGVCAIRTGDTITHEIIQDCNPITEGEVKCP